VLSRSAPSALSPPSRLARDARVEEEGTTETQRLQLLSAKEVALCVSGFTAKTPANAKTAPTIDAQFETPRSRIESFYLLLLVLRRSASSKVSQRRLESF
jgi:hypothetical protein